MFSLYLLLVLDEVTNLFSLLIKIGMKDCFGKSGKAQELLKYFKLDKDEIISKVKEM